MGRAVERGKTVSVVVTYSDCHREVKLCVTSVIWYVQFGNRGKMSCANSKKFTSKILLLSGFINSRGAQIFVCVYRGNYVISSSNIRYLTTVTVHKFWGATHSPFSQLFLCVITYIDCEGQLPLHLNSNSVCVVKGDYKYMAWRWAGLAEVEYSFCSRRQWVRFNWNCNGN